MGAETAAGRALAAALAESGARFALVAATAEPEVAFEVQRLARRSGAALSQAIDARNEMAVRVMVRQVSKGLGGLDLLLFCADLGRATGDSLLLAARFAAREMGRGGGGAIVVAAAAEGADIAALAAEHEARRVRVLAVEAPQDPDEAWARSVLDVLRPHP